MRRRVRERPRVAALSALAAVTAPAAAALVAGSLAETNSGPERRAQRAELVASGRTRDLQRIRQQLTATSSALAKTTRRADAARRASRRRRVTAERWKARALLAERRLKRTQRGRR